MAIGAVVAVLLIAALLVLVATKIIGGSATTEAEGEQEYCAVEAPESEIDIEEHGR